MSGRKSAGYAAERPSPAEIVCILVVDAVIDEVEVEIPLPTSQWTRPHFLDIYGLVVC
jgi:hypothetical protein